jgi:hypothetical protein
MRSIAVLLPVPIQLPHRQKLPQKLSRPKIFQRQSTKPKQFQLPPIARRKQLNLQVIRLQQFKLRTPNQNQPELGKSWQFFSAES